MRNLANLAASAWQMIEIDQGGGTLLFFGLPRACQSLADAFPASGAVGDPSQGKRLPAVFLMLPQALPRRRPLLGPKGL